MYLLKDQKWSVQRNCKELLLKSADSVLAQGCSSSSLPNTASLGFQWRRNDWPTSTFRHCKERRKKGEEIHLKNSINDGVVLHEIVPHIKRYPVSHTPKKKHILWRQAAPPTAAISMCIISRCVLLFLCECVNCLKSAHQLHCGIDILARFYSLLGGSLTAYLTVDLSHQPTLPGIVSPTFLRCSLRTTFLFQM